MLIFCTLYANLAVAKTWACLYFYFTNHGLINYIEIDLGDFAACIYLSEAPAPPRFLFGWSTNCLGSGSGQIQSIKLLQNHGLQQESTPTSPS